MVEPHQPDERPERDWSEEAKGLLKAELKRRNITYGGLVRALEDIGVRETEANLRNKISRGNFSAAFLLQCLDAIGCFVLYLGDDPMAVIRGRANIGPATRSRYHSSEEEMPAARKQAKSDPSSDS